jgi:hypothetical protein
MKITEVLDSTKIWAELKGINLEIFNSLEADYQALQEIIHNSYTIKLLGLSSVYVQTQSVIKDLASNFIKDSQAHIDNLSTIDMQDPDIAHQVSQLQQMIANLR